MRSKGIIGVGAREGKGVRAFVIIHNQHLVFLREKKSLQKSQMMDPVALLHGNILLGIFYSFKLSTLGKSRAGTGSRGNLSLEVK